MVWGADRVACHVSMQVNQTVDLKSKTGALQYMENANPINAEGNKTLTGKALAKVIGLVSILAYFLTIKTNDGEWNRTGEDAWQFTPKAATA